MFIRDFIFNGAINGPVGAGMQSVGWDSDLRRPFYDKDGNAAVTIRTGRTTTVNGRQVPVKEHRLVRDLVDNGINSPVFNATELRKEEWIELDRVVLRAARYRLRAYADLAAYNSFGGFNGMSKEILEYETMTDPGMAIVDMDGLSEGNNDTPIFQLQGLPLPITHADFFCGSRKLAISRNTGTPFDATMGESCGRRVAESIEKTTIGVVPGITYGGQSTMMGGYSRSSSVYGYLNFPPRLTITGITVPDGTNPDKTVDDILGMVNASVNHKFYGPWMLYYSGDFDPFMNNDYQRMVVGGATIGGTMTLKERLKRIDGIIDVKRLDFLFASLTTTSGAAISTLGPGSEGVVTARPWTLILVQMTPDVARAVNGMDITTVQWETMGGMKLMFRVMAIQVPQLRADAYGNCGIICGSAT